MSKKELELEILPSGQIRFSREDLELESLLQKLIDKKNIKEIKDFFKDSEKVKLLFGDRIYCG